jgi:hypothetical protein
MSLKRTADTFWWAILWEEKLFSFWHRSGRQGWWDLFWLRPRLQRRKTFRNLQGRLSFTPMIIAKMPPGAGVPYCISSE